VILLDTHVAFWLNNAPEKLSPAAARAIRRAASSTGLGLSSISLWELALLVEKKRLRLKTTRPGDFLRAIVHTPGLSVLEIDVEIATRAAQLPSGFPGDPADRFIAATAVVHGIPLVTKDRGLSGSTLLRTIW